MSHLSKLLWALLLCCTVCAVAASPALARPEVGLVCKLPPELLDREALRTAVEAELRVPTALLEQPRGPTVQVEGAALSAVQVSFVQEDKPSLSRTLDVSAQADHAAEIIALLAANLVRDEASELLAQLAAADEAAPPSPAPPPPALVAPKPVRASSGCQPTGLRRVPLGADIVPYFGTSLRDGTHVERGLSFNLIGGITDAVRGFELAGVFNIERVALCGVQLANAFNFVMGDAAGAQLSMFNYAGGNLLGAQLSMLNVAGGQVGGAQLALVNVAGGRVAGAQLGLANLSSGDLDGAQLGLVNVVVGRARGAQLGLVNIATRRVDGALVGLVNVAQDADAAIGLVNVIWKGRAQLDAWATDAGLLMLGTTQGARLTHNIYGIGWKPTSGTSAFSVAFGFGFRVVRSRWLTLDIDALSYGLMGKSPEAGRVDYASIHQLRVPISFSPLPGVAVFVAPSVSVSTVQSDSHLQDLALFGSKRLTAADSSGWVVRLWPGLSVGARFF